MRATDRTPGRPRDGREARARGAGGRRPGAKAVERSVRRARRASAWGRAKYAGSWAEYPWHRPDAFDFLNQVMLPAAMLLLRAGPAAGAGPTGRGGGTIDVAACTAPRRSATRFLPTRQVARRRPGPCSVATGTFGSGMLIVLHFIFSGTATGLRIPA